jgi:hypothetical protein
MAIRAAVPDKHEPLVRGFATTLHSLHDSFIQCNTDYPVTPGKHARHGENRH